MHNPTIFYSVTLRVQQKQHKSLPFHTACDQIRERVHDNYAHFDFPLMSKMCISEEFLNEACQDQWSNMIHDDII